MIRLNVGDVAVEYPDVAEVLQIRGNTGVIQVLNRSLDESVPIEIVGGGVSSWNDLEDKPTTIAGFGILDAYTKTEIDSALANVDAIKLGGQLPAYYTDIVARLGYTPADQAVLAAVATTGTFDSLSGKPTTIGGYGITDAYTKTQSDAALAGKQARVESVAGLEIGASLTGDRVSLIDLHADDTNTDYSARVMRNPGADGNLIVTNMGAGSFLVALGGAYPFMLSAAGAASFTGTLSVTGDTTIAGALTVGGKSVLTVESGYTRTQVDAAISSAIQSLLGADVPAALDTLKEIADSINDDANFAATITTQLGTKLSTTGTAADSSKLGGQLPSYYTNIVARLGFTPLNATAQAVDSAKLGEQLPSYYLSASNLNAGTIPDARLPARLGIVSKQVTDWDAATENGFYEGTATALHAPTASYYIGVVSVYSTGWKYQLLRNATSSTQNDTLTYQRFYNAVSNTWGSWYRIRLSEAEQQALWDARYLPLTIPRREVLTAIRYYYVDKTGADTNDGLTAGTAFLTIQKAVNVALALDMSIYSVTIIVGAGTFNEGSMLLVTGNGNARIMIQGAGYNQTSIVGTSYAVQATYSAQVTLFNVDLSGGAVCVWSRTGAQIYFAGDVQLSGGGARLIGADFGGIISMNSGNLRINASSAYLFYATQAAQMGFANGANIITSKAVNFTNAVAYSSMAGVVAFTASQVTWNVTAGAITGPRYNATLNGVVTTFGAGASWIPGSAAGTVATGGQYS